MCKLCKQILAICVLIEFLWICALQGHFYHSFKSPRTGVPECSSCSAQSSLFSHQVDTLTIGCIVSIFAGTSNSIFVFCTIRSVFPDPVTYVTAHEKRDPSPHIQFFGNKQKCTPNFVFVVMAIIALS